MQITGLRTVGTIALGVAIVATTSVGVTLAVTPSSSYKACATSSHVLVLRTSAGKCPKHSSAVTLGAQGPRGVHGARGLRGIQGKPGNPGKDLTAAHNVVVVSAVDSDAASGTALLNAITAIAGEGPATIELGPGTFDLGTSTLTLPGNVRLVGAGTDQTVISGDPSTGILVSTGNTTTIDDLEVLYAGSTSEERTAISVPAAALTRLNRVDVELETDSTANSQATGIDVAGQVEMTGGEIDAEATTSGSTEAIGVHVESGSVADLTGVRDFIDAAGSGDLAYGVYAEGSANIDDLNAIVGAASSAIPTGVAVFPSGQTTIRDSSIDAGSSGIALVNTAGTLLVADSMVNGSALVTSCVGDYNGDFIALNTSCT